METGAPLLETTTAEISSTVPQETLKLLPQTGGIPDWQSFLTFLPGTRGNGTNNNSPGMGGVSVNGSMPFSNALLDGASTSSPMSNNVINTPIFDTLGEVKMSSSAFSAQYGGGGMVYNQISKGGSNQFHGMVYDYFKNTALNAAPFGFNGVSFKTPQHFNDFGFNIGGPVIKNKVFFFFGVDHTINHTTPAVSFATVPTLAMREGNFAGLNPIYDPTTQTVNSTTGVVTRTLFPNNQIPVAMLDTVAKNIQAFYPQPNRSGQVVNGITTNNYSYLAPGDAPKRKYFGRFDADITSNNRITGSAAWNDGPSKPFSPVAPINLNPGDVMNMSGQLSDYWTISPTLINELRIGFMGEYDVFHPATIGQGFPAKLGLKFSKADIFPNVTISNYYGLGPGSPSQYRVQREHLRYFGPGDSDPRTPPPPLWRRGAHLPSRFHRVGQYQGCRSWFHRRLYRGQQHWSTRLRFRLCLCGLPVGLCAELERAEFARIRRPPEESRRLLPGRLQSNPETHPEPRSAVGRQHGLVRSLRQRALVRSERDQSRHQCSRRLWFATTKANGRERLQKACL